LNLPVRGRVFLYCCGYRVWQDKMSVKVIKILLVEKDRQLLAPLEAQLKEIPEVELCAKALDYEQLSDSYKKIGPDIILLDLSFDDDSIYSFLSSLETQAASGRLALIALAGSSDMNRIRKAMKAGCADFLMLPVKTEEISSAIKSAYENNQSIVKNSSIVSNGKRVPSGKVITIFSTKGGVGKSTIAVNLAVTLAMFLKDSGRKVALLDGNFQFGDVGFMLNLKPEKTIHGLVREMGEPAPLSFEVMNNFITTHHSGLDILLAPSKPQFAEEVTMLHLGYIMECLKKNYDYVIVDTIHHINDTDLTIFDWTDSLFIVATLEVTTIKNLVLTVEILKDLQIPKDKISLILNRAYQKMGVECSTVEEKLMKISCMIPSDGERVVASLNSGAPFVADMQLDIPIVKSFYELASMVACDEDKSHFNKEDMAKNKGNVFDFFKKLIKK